MSIRFAAPSRREFVSMLGGAGLATAGVANILYNPKLAIHTSTWLVEAAARNKRPADILDEALNTIQKAGYRRLELVEEFTRGDIRERILARMERANLEPSVVATRGPMHTAEAAQSCREWVIPLARFFAGRATFLSFTAAPKPGGARKTDGELDAQAYQLELLGLELQRAGLPLLLDHDTAAMAEGGREWRHMLAHTEPRVVSFCLDVEDAIRGSANPWTLMEAAGGRLRSVHLRNTRHGADMDELADGDIDLEQIGKLLREQQYDGFLVVELRRPQGADRRRDLATALAWSRWRMQEVFGSRPGGFPVDMGPHVRFPKPSGR